MSASLTRIGLYIDGAHFNNASFYYTYNHARSARLSLHGMRNFVVQRIAEEEAVPVKLCRVVEAHYFSGRSGHAESRDRETDSLAKERWWDGILMKADITAHYLPYGPRGEKGIDVLLSLECFEAATLKGLDVVVLVTGDSDFIPLVRKLNSRGVRVMVFGFTYQFQNLQGRERGSGTSRALLNEANYPVAVDELIEKYSDLPDAQKKLVDDLFVRRRSTDEEPDEGGNSGETADANAERTTAPASPLTATPAGLAHAEPGLATVEPATPPEALTVERRSNPADVDAAPPSSNDRLDGPLDRDATEPEEAEVAQQEFGEPVRRNPRRYGSLLRRTPASRESLERLARDGLTRTVEVVRPANFVTGVSEISRDRVPGQVTTIKQGYGFIKSEWGKESLFFYHADVENEGFEHLQPGSRVTFIEMKGDRGMVAKYIRVSEDSNDGSASSTASS